MGKYLKSRILGPDFYYYICPIYPLRASMELFPISGKRSPVEPFEPIEPIRGSVVF